jgi:hypothetical protein
MRRRTQASAAKDGAIRFCADEELLLRACSCFATHASEHANDSAGGGQGRQPSKLRRCQEFYELRGYPTLIWMATP